MDQGLIEVNLDEMINDENEDQRDYLESEVEHQTIVFNMQKGSQHDAFGQTK